MRLVPEVGAPSDIGVDGELVSPAEVGILVQRQRLLEVVCYPGVLRIFMA